MCVRKLEITRSWSFLNLFLKVINGFWLNIILMVVLQLSWTFKKEGTKLEWRWKFQPSPDEKKTTAGILDLLMDANIRLSVTRSFCCFILQSLTLVSGYNKSFRVHF